MNDTDEKYYSRDFTEENGKTFVLFYDPEGNLIARREILDRMSRDHQTEWRKQLTRP